MNECIVERGGTHSETALPLTLIDTCVICFFLAK